MLHPYNLREKSVVFRTVSLSYSKSTTVELIPHLSFDAKEPEF